METQHKINHLRRFVLGLQVSEDVERQVTTGFTIRSHYSYQPPMIDMGAYRPWLISEIKAKGGRLGVEVLASRRPKSS